MSHRFISLSMLGAMALVASPLAGAEGFEREFDDEQRQEIRAELMNCRDNNEEHDDRKACAQSVFESRGLEMPEHGRRGRRGDHDRLPEGAREELKECHNDNEEHEDKRECAKEVAEKHGFEIPEHVKRRTVKRQFRSTIIDACGERNDTDEWKECARENRRSTLQNMREEYPRATRRFVRNRRFSNLDDETKAELKACRQLDTREEKKACFTAVRDQHDSE